MKNGWQIPWNVAAICETFKISCLMGRHHMKDVLECPLTNQQYRLEQWSNITLFLRKTYRDYINLIQKSCQVYSLDMCCPRVESGKVTLWSHTLKNWRRWTHLNSTPQGSMQRKCQQQWEVTHWNSQSQMEQSNFWRGSGSENILLNPGQPRQRRRTR